MNGTQHAGPDGPPASAGAATRPVAAARAEIRPVRGSDRDALREFLGRLSLRTRYLRFFTGVLPVTPAMLRRLSGGVPGGDHIDALVATEDGAIIGHAMATDSRSPSGAGVTEMGVVVADGWQGHGVGSALMRALTSRAQARGATAIMMDVLAENRPMLALIMHYFPAARYQHSGPYVTIHVPLPRSQEEQAGESPIRERHAQPRPLGGRCGESGRQRARRGRESSRAAAGLSVG